MARSESRKKGDLCPNVRVEIKGKKDTLRERSSCAPLVVVFYGGDLSPYAIVQLQRFKHDFPKFASAGIEIIAFGTGNEAAHEEFMNRFHFPFTCLLDKKKTVARSFGVLEKKGRASSVQPYVFTVDQEGVIRFSHRGFPKIHDVLKSLRVS